MAANFEERLNNFIDHHESMIGKYEELEDSIPLTYCIDDIIESYKLCQKTNKSLEFETVLYNGLNNAIKYNTNIIDGIALILKGKEQDTSNSTQQYFKEVNDVYNKNGNNYNIEYTPENREKMIEMNLKSVISIAKHYQGLGLSLNELISAGNLGLVISWDKFDPSRSKLHDDVINDLKDMPEEFDFKSLYECIGQYMQYGDIKKKFEDKFHAGVQYNKRDVIKWVNKNIYNAKFNSIATMWIRAYILIEIDNYSRVVKKPKAEIYKDREVHGAYKKEVTLDIDAPISEESGTCFGDMLHIEDDSGTDLEISEAYDTYKNGLNQLLDGVKPRDRSIFLKKFGIGLPRPMLPKEIADQEGLSIARISQIFQTVTAQIQKNQVKFNINPDVLYAATKKIY